MPSALKVVNPNKGGVHRPEEFFLNRREQRFMNRRVRNGISGGIVGWRADLTILPDGHRDIEYLSRIFLGSPGIAGPPIQRCQA